MRVSDVGKTPNPGAANAPSANNPMHGEALDVEWSAVKAAEAMRYLALHYPECSGSEALHPHQDAAHAAAVAGGEAMKRFKAFVFGKGAA